MTDPTSGPDDDARPSGPSSGPPSAASDTVSPNPAVRLPDDLAEAARRLFGDRLPLAEAYAELLAGPGVVRGLIGPRETPRIWDRHLLNCAAVAELIPTESSVVDVGSGAGLPGIVLAIARPDLSVTLIEPLARRAMFLTEAVDVLDLGGAVTVLRARAEEIEAYRRRAARGGTRGRAVRMAGSESAGRPEDDGPPWYELADVDNLAELSLPAEIVTARAVAPLDRLAAWCLPLVAPGGRLLALKGATAADEAAEHAAVVRRLGGSAPEVRRCGVGVVDPPTTVIEVVRERAVAGSGRGRAKTTAGRRSAGRARRRPTH
ncbi:16S rRNA (guanine(527)-N(7))-methyltransferase RsmG [Micromonospora sp. HM5-17]|uniref:16S rRNA (guanine(527)-N(7))-methyltransferase RsmG n=1 Tax=Micromonospora sp. HM5-17 TaxID=2487710 RepID=UPI000F481AEF|nr:16S rRNA (guanine(527)-N(7))-methyltransferase RsmG [Micromonospora sp. HM5-17]ROT33623.1 16S rRNA (guanine(527)-N(7))-methyltransferase RsmG [Micromonospora sp. HM5-17]